MEENIAETAVNAVQSSIWAEGLQEAYTLLLTGAADYVPKIIVAFIVIIVGWLIGAMLGRLVSRLMRVLKVDGFLKSAGTDDLFIKVGIKLNSGAFVGGLVKWFVIVLFLLASFNILGLDQVNTFLQSVLDFLPKLIVSVLILLVGAVVADAVNKVVVRGAKDAGVTTAQMLGGIAKWAILVFAVLISLDQVNITDNLSNILFISFGAMIAIAGGLAFGLGGREVAGRYIEKLEKDFSNRKKED